MTFFKQHRVFTVLALCFSLCGGMFATDRIVASANEAFVKYAPGSGDYADRVRLNTVCKIVKQAKDDAIVFPGLPGMSHNHTFAGSKAINASSTAEQLYAGQTSCSNPADKSSYWVPTLYNGNTPIVPGSFHPYYRPGGTDSVGLQPMPFGIKLLAGDPKSTQPQSQDVAAFRCRDDKGLTIKASEAPMACNQGNFLESFMHFPSCWDGIHLDSPDHRSHTSYPANGTTCDAAHPVRIPQLTLEIWYNPGTTQDTSTFEPDMHMSKYAMHADFFNAWDPNEMQMFVDKCFKANQSCEEMTDQKRPPGVGPQHMVAAPKTKFATPTAVPVGKLSASSSNAMAGMQMGSTANVPAARGAVKITKKSPTSGTITGSGFSAGAKLEVYVTTGKRTGKLTITATAAGAFTANYRLPAASSSVVVNVVPNGSTTGIRATA